MAASIQQELVSMQTATAINRAKELKSNGASQELDGDAFLMLMLEQLKNQGYTMLSCSEEFYDLAINDEEEFE